MRDRAVNLSDLERAKQLSQRLSRREVPKPSLDFSTFSPPYLRLQQPSAQAPVRAPQVPQVRAVTPPPSMDGWEPLIKWCLSHFGAESGFAVDTQGFVIATAGQSAHDGFEGMGAELCYALEQLERVDSEAGGLLWVDLEFSRRRIVCLRAAPEGMEPMILGFIGANPNYIAIRDQVEHAVLDAMREL